MTSAQRRQIEELGFKVPQGTLLGSDVPLVAFDAAEDHPNWPILCCLLPLAQEPSGAIAKTRQAFGDGWGLREVIISQNLRQAMLAHQIRGAEFMPLEAALPAVVA